MGGDLCRWNLGGGVRLSFRRPEKNPPEIITFAARCRSHGGTGRTRSHAAQRGLDGGREEPPRRCELDRSAAPAQADAGRAAHSGRRTWERIRARLRTLAAQLPHRWIFTSLCFLSSFLPNQVINRPNLADCRRCRFSFSVAHRHFYAQT